MPNFLIFLYLCAFKISCSIELSMKKVYNLWARCPLLRCTPTNGKSPKEKGTKMKMAALLYIFALKTFIQYYTEHTPSCQEFYDPVMLLPI